MSERAGPDAGSLSEGAPEMLTDPKRIQQILLAGARQAGSEILLAPLRLDFDAVGQLLLSELEYACRRGVRVCCLLDREGSRAFITEHPALLERLDTCFRIRSNRPEESRIIFDRRMALEGCYAVTEQGTSEKVRARVRHDREAAAMAEEFEVIWHDCPAP